MTESELRQPIVSVLGHVDSGKTTLLDGVRGSSIVEDEAGSITQMIGSTEVPIETLRETCGELLEALDTDITLPGLLFIDTPGHAAFSSLRSRGGSISDIAVLVVDIKQGVQPQTEEAIEILSESETPFVVALNKVDTLRGWRNKDRSFSRNLQKQTDEVQKRLNEKVYGLMGELDEHGITGQRFDRVDNFQKKVAIVPVSAETGEGIPELLMVMTGLSQNYLSERLEVSEGVGEATVLEVSEEKGHGETVDVIHHDGVIESSDFLVYGTSEGARTTEIRALLKPEPLREMGTAEFEEIRRSTPAAGIKVSGRELEGAIPGAPVRATSEDIEEAVEEVERSLDRIDFDTSEHGIVVKADSLGSLEAITKQLEDVDVQRTGIGAVDKSDAALAEDEQGENRAVFAFNVESEIETDARVFQADVVYEILQEYEEWTKLLEEKSQEERLEEVSRPAEIEVLPDHVFRQSDPAVVGVKVVRGTMKPGSMLMNQDGESVGLAKSVQAENESLDSAEKGDQVAVSISNATVGRTFEEGDRLLVDISADDYSTLRDLRDLLGADEQAALDDTVEIKDSVDPHWKL